jgi:hypothetical protein
MKRIILVVTVFFLLFQPLLALEALSFFGPVAAHAQDDWKTTFNEVCAKTQNAMAYTSEELRDFIARCDALKTEIEKLQEPEKTIYLKRLKGCRGLFDYVLASKEKE